MKLRKFFFLFLICLPVVQRIQKRWGIVLAMCEHWKALICQWSLVQPTNEKKKKGIIQENLRRSTIICCSSVFYLIFETILHSSSYLWQILSTFQIFIIWRKSLAFFFFCFCCNLVLLWKINETVRRVFFCVSVNLCILYKKLCFDESFCFKRFNNVLVFKDV